MNFSLIYSNPVLTSNESGEGISHFENYMAVDISWEEQFSGKNFWGIKLSYGRYSFSNDYMTLTNPDLNNILHKIGLGSSIYYTIVNGKNIYLALRSTGEIVFLTGQNRIAEKNNGFDFPAFGFGITTGPNLGINIIKDFDLHIGADLNFNYYNQILFQPNIYVSISKWIN